jgi:hypothetical protein
MIPKMKWAKREVSADKVRSYVDELEHVPSVIRIPDQILNMDETRLCSRPMKAPKRRLSVQRAAHQSFLQGRDRRQSREPAGNDQFVRAMIQIALFNSKQGYCQGSRFATSVQ